MNSRLTRPTLSNLGLALSIAGLSLLAPACVANEPVDPAGSEDETVDEAAQPITDGSPADMFSRQRAGFFMRAGCTGTIIGPRTILAASHCEIVPNDEIRFYTSTDVGNAPPPDPATARFVQSVTIPAGVSPSNSDFIDSNGKFADVAVIRLTADVPATSVVGDMNWVYPGSSTWGTKVGGARTSALINDRGFLRMTNDMTASGSDGDGGYYTLVDQTTPGDSGGPFYVASRTIGTLYGSVGTQNRYTSVPFHLNFIVNAMGYEFSGQIFATGYILNGQDQATYTGRTQTACAYICDHTASCVAFNHYPNLGGMQNVCQLKKTFTGAAVFAGATSGLK
ncbi:MAG: trypsin-like serine protease [Polyangiaceae bacterium]